MKQFKFANVHSYFNRCVSYSRLVARTVANPRLIRSCIALFDFIHVAEASVRFHNPAMRAEGMILYLVCRGLEKRAVKWRIRNLKVLALIAANFFAALEMSPLMGLEGYIDPWTGEVPAKLISAAILTAFFSAVETLVEEYHRAHNWHELAGDRVTLGTVHPEPVAFDNPHSGYVRITVSAAANSLPDSVFNVKVCDENLKRLYPIRRIGGLATGSVYLPGGRFYIVVTSQKGPRFTVFASASINVKKGPETSAADDPIKDGSLVRDLSNEPDPNQYPPRFICPTGTQASRAWCVDGECEYADRMNESATELKGNMPKANGDELLPVLCGRCPLHSESRA